MKYTLTKDLETGNALIDNEHRQLFDAVNKLMDACSQGKGRDLIEKTVHFLSDYVAKHFHDEEQLQMQSKYPGYSAHRQFHEQYKQKLAQVENQIINTGATIATLGKLNEIIGVLITHIRMDDKRIADHIKASS